MPMPAVVNPHVVTLFSFTSVCVSSNCRWCDFIGVIFVLLCGPETPETLTAAELIYCLSCVICLVRFLGSFGCSRSVWVCWSLSCFPDACRINTNQCHTSHESASSQAVTTEPSCQLPKDTFIMHPYIGLEGQRSCSSFCQLIRKSIDQFAGVGWCFWEYTCLSVSKNPGTRGCRYTPLRINKEFHPYRWKLLSCAPLPCLLESGEREQSRHLWNHLNFKCMRWLCQWISLVTYCGII